MTSPAIPLHPAHVAELGADAGRPAVTRITLGALDLLTDTAFVWAALLGPLLVMGPP